MLEPAGVGGEGDAARAEPRGPGRIPALDGLRGVAALVVVVHHALLASSIALAGIYRDEGTPSGLSGALVDTPLSLLWDGREAVFVFFVLSGFVLAVPYARGKDFSALRYYPARLIRLYLPVWGAMAVSAALYALVDPSSIDTGSWWLTAHSGDFTPKGTVADGSLFLADSFMFFSAIWSLKWEILFSVLLPLYLWLGGGGRALRIVLVVACLAAIASERSDYLTFLPVFMLGTILAYEHTAMADGMRRLGRPGRATVLLAGLALLCVTSWGGDLPFGAQDALIALGAVAVVALGSLSVGALPRLLEARPVHWLGTRSFSLYLVHEPAIVTLAVLTDAGIAPVPFVLLSVPLALGAAELFYRGIEHPSHRLARRVRAMGGLPRRLATAK
jgi:peptidoglycan/LPS O-acetylase OafA/YrhL